MYWGPCHGGETRNVEHARIGIHWTWYFIRCIHFQTRYASYQGISYSTQNTQICCDIYPNKMLKQIVNKYPKPKTSTTSVYCKRTVVMFFFPQTIPYVFTLHPHHRHRGLELEPGPEEANEIISDLQMMIKAGK